MKALFLTFSILSLMALSTPAKANPCARSEAEDLEEDTGPCMKVEAEKPKFISSETPRADPPGEECYSENINTQTQMEDCMDRLKRSR